MFIDVISLGGRAPLFPWREASTRSGGMGNSWIFWDGARGGKGWSDGVITERLQREYQRFLIPRNQ
jgi:hypothetical protein